jgi:hypothetical protein
MDLPHFQFHTHLSLLFQSKILIKMARSQDAMRKRAEKRNRTLTEQRKADSADMRKQLEQEAAAKKQRMMDTAAASIKSSAEPVGHYGPPILPVGTQTTSNTKPNLEVEKKAAAAPAAPMDKKEEHISTNRTAATDTRTDTRTINSNSSSNIINNVKKSDPLDEQGSWKCPGCYNHNFASRSVCNSKTCSEQRPAGIPLPIQRHLQPSQQHLQPSLQRQRPPPPNNNHSNNNNNNKRPNNSHRPKGRHDVATSKSQSWAQQADDATLAQNQALRQKLVESGGTGDGMDETDIKRAKTLIARDERKKQKKQERKEQQEQRKQKQQRK